MINKTIKKRNLLLYGLSIIILIAAWYGLSLIFNPIIVPRPHSIIPVLLELISKEQLCTIMIYTFFRSLIAFAIALLIGSIIGVLSGLFNWFESLSIIPMLLLQGTPTIIWIVPVILIFHTGTVSVILISALVVLPLVQSNIAEGVKNIKNSYYDFLKIYAPSPRLFIQEVIYPELFPYLRSTTTLGFVLAIKSAVIAEWFSSSEGIGKLINKYFYNYHIKELYATTLFFVIFITLMGFALQKIASIVLTRKKSYIDSSIKPTLSLQTNGLPIEVQNLYWSWGNKNVFSNITFKITSGEAVILSGDSGIGKTTLAKILAGILKPKQGILHKAKRPALIYQDDMLLEHLDLCGNVALPLRARNIPNPYELAYEALCLVGLQDFAHYFPDEISGGMKKRVTFARALTLDPDFIILDEPFNNLDKIARQELWELFFSTFPSRGIPALIITHYPEELSSRKLKHLQLFENSTLLKS